MMYVNFNAGNRDYKLRMSFDAILAFEKRTGMNPAAIFGFDKENPKIPTITTMVTILWASLQEFEHGISWEDAKKIFKTWVDEGNLPTDFLVVISDLYRQSGIFKKEEENADSEKN